MSANGNFVAADGGRRTTVVDERGIVHRPGCHLPGWRSEKAAVVGWHVVTCAACGVARLVRGGSQRPGAER